VSRWRVVN